MDLNSRLKSRVSLDMDETLNFESYSLGGPNHCNIYLSWHVKDESTIKISILNALGQNLVNSESCLCSEIFVGGQNP